MLKLFSMLFKKVPPTFFIPFFYKAGENIKSLSFDLVFKVVNDRFTIRCLVLEYFAFCEQIFFILNNEI